MKTRNRVLSGILALVLCVGMLPTISLTAFATVGDEFTVGDIKYRVTDETNHTVEVIKNNYSGSVTIPETAANNGTTYTVTKIGDDAFSNCTQLTSVTIGNNVKTIGDGAFYYCVNLVGTLTIPDSVTDIGNQAFRNCEKLIEIVIGDNVKTIGEEAFYYCISVTNITIGNSVENIGNRAFQSCRMPSLTIPGTVISIGEYVFYDTPNLTGIVLLSSQAPTLGNQDFNYTPSTLKIEVPAGATGYTEGNWAEISEKFKNKFVTLDTQGGTLTMGSYTTVTTDTDGKLTSLPNPTRTSYEFDGWYMPDGTTKVTTATTFSADTTVTAKWLEFPTAEDFTFTPPANLTYDGLPKTATVTVKDGIAGMGEITVKYEPVSAINADTYIVKIDVAEGTKYASATNITDASWTFTIGKRTPTVDTDPTASRVIIGGKLSDSTLTGGVASAPGTFAWKDGTEVLDTAQTVTKKVVFTPDDLDNYNTVEIDVDVTVVVCDTTSGEHDFSELKHDDKDHWYECAKCGDVKVNSKTAHTFEWKVDKEPTASKTGLKHEECFCGAKRNVDTVIPKTETNSPQTGDNSHMALWIALLFISGMGIVATTVYGRKKRQA